MKLDLGLLFLRLAAGLTMLLGHGLSKLVGFSEKSASFADPLGIGPAPSLALAVGAEFFCSLALIIGLYTRLALIPLLITMMVAFGIVHAADPFGRKELSFLYAIIFIALLFTGPGRYSIDAKLASRR